jgi:hypothetical protein
LNKIEVETMNEDAAILVGDNILEGGGPSFIKDQKAVGTVGENSALVKNVIFIDDEDILDFFASGAGKGAFTDDEIIGTAAQAKAKVKKVKRG